MESRQYILDQFNFNRAYALALTQDVPDALFASGAGPGLENHPAWTLGHLMMGAWHVQRGFGHKPELPEGWRAIFDRKGPGDPTLPADGPYPDREAITAAYLQQHQQVEALIANASEEDWNSPLKWRFETYFPSKGHMAAFMCIQHETMHLAQLSAWRRAQNLPSAFKEL